MGKRRLGIDTINERFEERQRKDRKKNMNRIEVVEKVNEALSENCGKPCEDLRKLGQAMVAIAGALEGQSLQEARTIMKSVAILVDVSDA